MPELIEQQDRGAVRLLTLNRPDKLNALNGALSGGLEQAVRAAGADPSVAAIVLNGRGRAFSAGADMKEAEAHRSQSQRAAVAASGHATAVVEAIMGVDTPVIAAVNGFALGAGCAMAIAADIVVAGDTAVFGYPEVRRGLAATAVTPTLVAGVNRKIASELLLLCENVPAPRAESMGLVNRVVADDAVLDTALAMAETLAGFDHDALWMTKRMIRRSADLPLDQAHGLAADNLVLMRGFST